MKENWLFIIECNVRDFFASSSVDFIRKTGVAMVQIGLITSDQVIAQVQFANMFWKPNHYMQIKWRARLALQVAVNV